MNKTISFPLFANTQIMAQKFPLRFWATMSAVAAGGIGLIAMTYMLFLPKDSQCRLWLLPITSASTRFYCAQVAVEKRTTAGTLQAIAFLTGLPPSHWRLSESQQKIEELGMDLLTLADQAFQSGNLETAIDTVEKIPKNLQAYQLIPEHIQTWQNHWEKESKNHSKMENKLRQSRWNSALMRASGNLNITGFVKNEYRSR